MNMQKLRAQIAALQDATMDENKNFRTAYDEGKFDALTAVDALLDSLQEEPVSEEFEEVARDILDTYKPVFSSSTSNGEPIEYYSPGQMRTIFVKGIYCQKEHCLKGLMTRDLETAADKYAIKIYNMFIKDETTLNNKEGDEILSDAFKAGAKWQKENLWKDAQGDDLPEIDKEVIALIEAFGHYKVIFAHRVDENAEIHTSIDGKPLVLHPKRHDKGGWNIPDVKFWLDLNLPKTEE